MPTQTTPLRIQNLGLRVVLAGAVTVLALSGCGATKHDPPSEKAQIAHAVAGVHEEGAKIEACEGMRHAGIAWAKAMEGVVDGYGEAAGNSALTQSDEDSYKVEEAGKKAESLIPSLAEPVDRFLASLARIRKATGEGLQALTAAAAEAVAAWKGVFTACEAAIAPAAASSTPSEGTKTYPAAIQTNFLHACSAFGASTGACECALKEVEATISTSEFVEDEEKLAEGTPDQRLATPLGRIIGHCVGRQTEGQISQEATG
jgi:hypothetical protein